MRGEMKKDGKISLLLTFILLIIVSLNLTSAVTKTCYNCANCTAEIGNRSAGDIVELNNSISVSGSCIDFNGKDTITFDCRNYSNFIKGDDTLLSYGIFLSDADTGSNNNTIRNCNVSHFYNGIDFLSSANNTLFNLTLSSGSSTGIQIISSPNNTIYNVTANLNVVGIYIETSSNNTIINASGTSNEYGFLIYSNSHNNKIINSVFQESDTYDVSIEFDGSSDISCDNNFTNIIGSGGRAIEVYDYNAIIENKTLAGLILCDADNSVVRNVTIHGSDLLNNSALQILAGDNITIFDVNSSNNFRGVYLFLSSNNTLTNNTIKSNVQGGIVLTTGSNNNTFTNNTLLSSLYGFYILSSSNILLTNNLIINSSNQGIFFQSSSNNTLTNNIATSSRTSYGIFFAIGSGSILINNTASNNFLEGIRLQSGYGNSSLINNTANNNSRYGIAIDESLGNNLTNNIANLNMYGIVIRGSNNTMINNIANLNLRAGIYLQTSSNNTLMNNSASSNYFGVYLASSSRNIFSNMTILDNTFDGVNTTSGTAFLFDNSHNNTVKDSQIRRNYNQALYFQASLQNNITNNIIENHSNGGLKFNESSTGNILYNNFFNSTLNYNDTGSTGNFFNITKTLGINIVGGDYIGGNYWGYINKTGFSELCTDADGDDICDIAYNLSDGSYDYLPLKLITFVLPTLPGDTTSPSSGGGSAVPPIIQTSVFSITPETPAVIDISNSYMSARRIKISVNNPASNVSLTVKEVSISSANFQVGFQGTSYEAFEITTINLSNDNIKNAIIEFRVNKTRLLESNFTTNDVFLYRKLTNTSDWIFLNTTYLYDEDGYSRFSAVSSGFSTFLVFVSESECIPSEKRCFENEVQFCLGNKKWLVSEVCDYKCVNGACVDKGLQVNLNPLVVYPIIGIVVVGVLVSFISQRVIRKQKEKYLYTSEISKKFRG